MYSDDDDDDSKYMQFIVENFLGHVFNWTFGYFYNLACELITSQVIDLLITGCMQYFFYSRKKIEHVKLRRRIFQIAGWILPCTF